MEIERLPKSNRSRSGIALGPFFFSRKFLLASVGFPALPVLSIAYYVFATHQFLEKAKRGYETEPAREFDRLSNNLEKQVGYSRLLPAWIESSWVWGARDYTHLYKLRLPAHEAEQLEARFRTAAQTPSNSNTNFGLDGCDSYLFFGPSTAPVWWNCEFVDGLPSMICDNLRLSRSGNTFYLIERDF